MANTFKLENYELVQAVRGNDIPSVLIVVDDFVGTVKCTNTLEVQEIEVPEGAEDAEILLAYATGALKAGASVVFAPDFAPQLNNDVRTIITTTGITAPTKAEIDAFETDGILRIFVSSTAPTLTSFDDKEKSRFVYVDCTDTFDSLSNAKKAELTGFVAGQICVGYFTDCALPYSNIPVDSVITADDITYKASSDLNTYFHGNKTVFYNVNGVPCIFGIPTNATYDSGNGLWFDLTTRQTADYVADQIITTLRDKYPRTKRSQEVLTSMKASVLGILDSMQTRQIIENVQDSNVVVMTDVNDTYGVIISYTIDVVTPLYVVTIKQSVTLGDNTTALVG